MAKTFQKLEKLRLYLELENGPLFRVMHEQSFELLIRKTPDEVLRIITMEKRQEYNALFCEVETFSLLIYDKHNWKLDEHIENLERSSGEEEIKKRAFEDWDLLCELVRVTAGDLYAAHCVLVSLKDNLKKEQEFKGRVGDFTPNIRTEIATRQGFMERFKPASLWPLDLEYIVERLIIILAYMHLSLNRVFENFDETKHVEPFPGLSSTALGAIGKSLYYAEKIISIYNFVRNPISLDAKGFDKVYCNLPENIKHDLKRVITPEERKTRERDSMKHLTRDLLDILHWLHPLAYNTEM